MYAPTAPTSTTHARSWNAVRAPRPLRAALKHGATVLLGLVALSSGSAMARTICVGTGNELSLAMEEAAVNHQNDEIRIRTGTLTRSGAQGTVARWEYDIGPGNGDQNYSLKMSGGWTDCNTQVADPRETVLDAQYQGSAMYFELFSGHGDITLSNLTITRGFNNGTPLARASANLGVYISDGTATITFERLIVVAGRATTSNGADAGIKLVGSGLDNEVVTFNVRNNVIAYNVGTVTGGLSTAVSNSALNITNNSIFSNSSTDTSACRCAGLEIKNNANSYLSNNVVVDNVDGLNRVADVSNTSGNSYLRNNHIGNLSAPRAPVINLGMTTGAPGWDLVGIYPIPDPVSPLRDSGYNAPIGGIGASDLAGNTRRVNGTVDRGAIEAEAPQAPVDRIFADGFN